LDKIGMQFAQSLSTSFPDLREAHPELKRLDVLFKLVALATGIRTLAVKYDSFDPDMAFWLEQYRVAAVQTPATYPLRVRKETVRKGRETKTIELDGGVELRALILELNDGSITALRDLVIGARPRGNPLTWDVPLETWNAPGQETLATARSNAPAATDTYGDLGCTLDGRVYSLGDPRPTVSTFGDLGMPAGGIPDFRSVERLGGPSSGIGGVMLSGVAEIDGDGLAEVTLADGSFSLVIDGKNARIDPRLYRKFVTALWCVYYSDQDPGISLDPPDRDRDWDKKQDEKEFMKPEKHSVRHIGRVANTDLARVMREADYLMKKWAVGTERANYPGFKSVDGYYASGDAKHVGIGRRFWFVPEDLRFRQGGGLLLFDRGRMRLNTEYDRDGMRGQASPADQAFADFFTERYEAIAHKHRIYEELFEYAKLVSLAKYLKEQGVPLHWFLMAHKDLVLTEESPTEVDGLLKRSDCVRGLVTKGGVNLAATPSYRYDAETEATINRVFSRLPATSSLAAGGAGDQTASHIVPRKTSFDVAGESYTVLPQHSVACNKDCRGVRYQTDLALRQEGRPGLELVRYFDPQRQDGGEFGAGWHLLIPYRVKPADDGRRQFQNVTIPERMVLDNLVNGAREVLTFSEEGYRGVGYVPENAAASQVVRLHLMSNASFRLVDKLGNQFQFDRGGQLTDMALSPSSNHQVHFEYATGAIDAFEEAPFVVAPADSERLQFRQLMIPKRIEVTDSIRGSSEVLTFNDQGPIAGYVSQDERASRYRLAALLTNTGLQLVDKNGNETVFDPNWSFRGLLPFRQPGRIICSVSAGGQKVTFGYRLDRSGNVVIAKATLSQDHPQAKPMHAVRYQHDDEGRLCRVSL
jgi:hypothetical protein